MKILHNSSFVLTPANFRTGGCNNAIPFSTDDNDDVNTDYFPKLDSTQELLKYWKKNQKQLQLSWRSWIQDYLLALRETLPLAHKGPLKRQPKIGEIVLVKDDNLPCRAWKIAKIKPFIFSKDKQIRSVKIQLPNKSILDRAINPPLSLENTISCIIIINFVNDRVTQKARPANMLPYIATYTYNIGS